MLSSIAFRAACTWVGAELGKGLPSVPLSRLRRVPTGREGCSSEDCRFFLVIYIPGFEMFRHCQTKREAL